MVVRLLGILILGVAGAADGVGNPVINEIYYHEPHRSTEPEPTQLEFLEIFNPGPDAVDLNGWKFTRGIDFTFDPITLLPGSYLVIAADPVAFAEANPDVENVVGPWVGRLSNSGERIELRTAEDELVDRVRYANEGDWGDRIRDPDENASNRGWAWGSAHDGEGRSLELISADAPNDNGQSWGSSTIERGTPGQVNSIAASEIAPFITKVKHSPAVPTSTDAVTITARVEAPGDRQVASAKVAWRIAATNDPVDALPWEDLLPFNAEGRYIVPDSGALDEASPNWRELEFQDDAWQRAQQGFGFEVAGGTLEPFVTTNIEDEMRFNNAGVYLRFPFEVGTVDSINNLSLEVRYDDGFVAWLNGSEVARANAPDPIAWDSTATTSRSDSRSIVPEEFDLSSALPLLQNGTNVLTIQAMNTTVAGSDALIQARLRGQVQGGLPDGFETADMFDDGNHGDGIAGDGVFGAVLPSARNNAVIEFFVRASDGERVRHWPAPTDEGQRTNALYQVDDGEGIDDEGTVYRLVMTPRENRSFTRSLDTESDTQMNATFIATTDTGTVTRYRCGVRFRGNSSRNQRPTPVRVNLPSTEPWNDIFQLNLNNRSPWLQLIGMKLFTASGLRAPRARPVRLRINGDDQATIGQNVQPAYVHLDQLNEDYIDYAFPENGGGNMYKKNRPDVGLVYRAGNPRRYISDGWAKRNNSAAYDWTDLDTFLEGFSTNQNDEGYLERVEAVIDVDQWLRWFALNNIIANAETNISNGVDDDFTLYFGLDDTRARLVPHDLDSILGQGLQNRITDPNNSLFDMITNGRLISNLRVFFRTPEIEMRYYGVIREMLQTTFSKEQFDRMMEDNLRGWVPNRVFDDMIRFMDRRRDFATAEVEQALGPAPEVTLGTSLASQEAAAPTTGLYLNEVLALNSAAFENGGTFPDYVELRNGGATSVSLDGWTLTDDPDNPTKFTFPAGTQLAAGETLLVLADGESAAPGLHAGFSLDGDGETLLLLNEGVVVDTLTFGIQIADLAVARVGEDGTTWQLANPTPGAANGVGLQTGAASDLRINEWLANAEDHFKRDFVELHNPSDVPVALGGLGITDDLANRPYRHRVAELSYIPSGGYAVFFADGTQFSENSRRMPYALAAEHEWVSLVGANGVLIDQVDGTFLKADRSYGSTEEGMRTALLPAPTPGWENTLIDANASNLVASLRVTEIMYHPADGPGAVEFVELLNIGGEPLQLGGVRFSEGIRFTFPEMTLNPGSFVSISADEVAFRTLFGAEPMLAGTFDGKLDNGGEMLRLELPAPFEAVIQCFTYSDDWFPVTDGTGVSLNIRNYLLPAGSWNDASNWKPGTESGGSAGQNGPPEIISDTFAEARHLYPFTFSVTVLNGAQTYAAEGLPDGLSINSDTGQISGIPAVFGEFTVQLQASNVVGSAQGTLTLRFSETKTPEITSRASASVEQGSEFSYQIVADNEPDAFGAEGLPDGLSIDPVTGAISGTPPTVGESQVTLSAINNAGAGTTVLSLTVRPQPPPEITNAAAQTIQVDTGYGFAIQATESPFAFTAEGLPPGLAINESTGEIFGSPTELGEFDATVTASNRGGTGTANIRFNVIASPFPEALEIEGITFSPFGGSGVWRVETEESFDGEDSLRNPPLTQFEFAGFSGQVSGPDTLFFQWKFDGGSQDQFFFEIDGQRQIFASRDQDWTEHIVELSPGSHSFFFQVFKNSGGTRVPVVWLDAFHLASSPGMFISLPTEGSLDIGRPADLEITTTHPATSFSAEGLPDWLSLDTTTGRITGTPQETTSFSFTVTAVGEQGTHTKVFNYQTRESLDGAVGDPGLTWQTGGSREWDVVNNDGSNDNTSLRSGSLGDNQFSWLQTQITGPEVLRFDWKVVSEECCDRLAVSVDNREIESIGGQQDWREVTLPLTEGQHTIRWQYTKDGSVSEGRDAGWIDNIRLLSQGGPLLEAPALIQPPPGAFTFQIPTATPADSFEASGLPPDITLDETTGILSGTLPEDGVFDVSLTARNDRGESTAVMRIEMLPPFGDGHDAPMQHWLRGGDAAWVQEPAISHDGTSSVRSGEIGDNAESWIETTVADPAFVTFWARVSARSGDRLIVTTNEVTVVDMQGDADWTFHQFPIDQPATFRFTYTKNSSGASREDAAYLDEFTVTPTTFAGWLRLNGHPISAGASEDSDGDGVENLVEFAVNGSSSTNDLHLLPSVEVINGEPAFVMKRAGIGFQAFPEVQFLFESSPSLMEGSWTSDDFDLVFNEQNRIAFRHTASDGTRYFRLRLILFQ